MALVMQEARRQVTNHIIVTNAIERLRSVSTMKLTPENAQRLFEAGAFVVFSDLPAGTEVGIDGECVYLCGHAGHLLKHLTRTEYSFSPPDCISRANSADGR